MNRQREQTPVKRAVHRHLRRIAFAVAAVFVVAVVVVALSVWMGWYNVSAQSQHWSGVYKLLEYAKRQSVRQRAGDVSTPDFDDTMSRLGAVTYRARCQLCHGAPGVAPETLGLSMQPVPGPLTAASTKWQPKELYWIIANGIKMSGMPAWQYHLSERQMWEVVAYLDAMPRMAPETGTAAPDVESSPLQPADIARGRIALTQYACQSCHRIPGVVGADTDVGPPLDGVRSQGYISGTLPTTPDNLALWIRHPKRFKPGGAMPELGVTPQDARDMAAYLLQPGK